MPVSTIAPTWTNPVNHLDVTNDTHVVPQDALVIINYLNDHPGDSSPPPPPAAPPPYYDVTGDGNIVAQDAIWIINYLNDQLSSGEGEVVPAPLATMSATTGEQEAQAVFAFSGEDARGHANDRVHRQRDQRMGNRHKLCEWRNSPTTGQAETVARERQFAHIARARCDHESFRGIDEWMGRFEIELVDEEVLDKLCDRRGQLERLRI